jgi:uncharacterized protein (TIGR02001 family)
MIKTRLVTAGALLALAGAAHADFSVTPTVASDYDFRGISQTAKDPAFQLGATYSHESGFYASVWGSNVDFGGSKPDVELDYILGFAGGDSEASFGYDIGAVYYTYVSAGSVNYPEIYAGISKGWFSGKVWYSPDVADTTSWYTEANGSFPLPQDFSLSAHLGYSFGNYWDSLDSKYVDWSVGVARSFGNFDASLKYIDGSDLVDLDSLGSAFCQTQGVNCNVFSTDKKVVLSVSTTLPWKSE